MFPYCLWQNSLSKTQIGLSVLFPVLRWLLVAHTGNIRSSPSQKWGARIIELFVWEIYHLHVQRKKIFVRNIQPLKHQGLGIKLTTFQTSPNPDSDLDLSKTSDLILEDLVSFLKSNILLPLALQLLCPSPTRTRATGKTPWEQFQCQLLSSFLPARPWVLFSKPGLEHLLQEVFLCISDPVLITPWCVWVT